MNITLLTGESFTLNPGWHFVFNGVWNSGGEPLFIPFYSIESMWQS